MALVDFSQQIFHNKFLMNHQAQLVNNITKTFSEFNLNVIFILSFHDNFFNSLLKRFFEIFIWKIYKIKILLFIHNYFLFSSQFVPFIPISIVSPFFFLFIFSLSLLISSPISLFLFYHFFTFPLLLYLSEGDGLLPLPTYERV